jgi:hypothetical protein
MPRASCASVLPHWPERGSFSYEQGMATPRVGRFLTMGATMESRRAMALVRSRSFTDFQAPDS